MSKKQNTTPKFKNPPLVETLLGFQFEPLSAMKVVHFGLFWKQININDRFPNSEEQGQLLPQFESKEVTARPLGLLFRQGVDLPRVLLLSDTSEAGQNVIQLQNDRFLQNWRCKNLANQGYPSFDSNEEVFQKDFYAFIDFAKEYDLGRIKLNQCEVTYVNRIALEDGLSLAEMCAKVVPFLATAHSVKAFPSAAEQITFVSSFWIDAIRGRIHIQISPAVSTEENRQMLDFRLTARGAPSSDEPESGLDWLRHAHDYVNEGFAEMTSSEMHSKWVRER
jgi:uncharacterized protein (TIGR04255 family)